MFEVYVLVAKKKSDIVRFMTIFCFMLGGISMLATLIGLYIFLPLAVIGLLIGYFLHNRNYEYEYSFFDDEIRFAKIINKSRRKQLPGYRMAEVVAIAPKGDTRVANYESDSRANIRNLTSGYKHAKIYTIAVKTTDGVEIVYFEPDEAYLTEIRKRFGFKVQI